MKPSSIIIIIILAVLAVFAISTLIIRKKKKKNGCCCSCTNCNKKCTIKNIYKSNENEEEVPKTTKKGNK